MKGSEPVDQEVPCISKAEERAGLQSTKNGKAVGPDEIQMEV